MTRTKAKKSRATAVVAGALATVAPWVATFIALMVVLTGNLPWLLTGSMAILSAVLDGHTAARLETGSWTRFGAGIVTNSGLAALLVATIASRLAPTMTLAGMALAIVGTLAGGAGASLARKPG